MRRIAAAILVLLGTLCASGQSFDASQWEQGVTTLDAPWHLHFGDDPAFAQPNFDDSQWMLHRIDKDWASAGRKGYSGYAWYRVRVILPRSKEPLAIAIYPPANAAEVYIDGTLAGTIGRMRPKPVWSFLRDVYAVPVPPGLNGRSVEVALRVWEPLVWATSVGVGAAAHSSLVGTAGDMQRIVDIAQQNRWVAKIPDWVVDLLGVAVGLFSLGLFLLQRHAREYAYAGAFFCGIPACNLYYWISEQGASFLILVPLYFFQAALICLWLLFIWRFLRLRADRLLYACMAATSIGPIIAPLVVLGVISDAEYSWALATMNLFLATAVFVRLSMLARRGNRDAQLFLIPFSFWVLVSCIWAIFLALWASGIANLFSALTLHHGPRFDITWRNVFGLLSNLSVGAVLVLRFTRSAKQEQRLRTEMEAARRVQEQLVPTNLPRLAHFACEAAYRAASEVGGDFYQVFPRADGSALILVGDVSGKGLRAAMLGTLIVGGAGTLAQQNLGPAEMLGRLNQHLYGRTGGGFATCLCALLAPDGTLSMANAGHLPPYRNGRELACEPGLPLGVLPAADYTETRVQLDPGDALTFMSDGVVEARSAAGELFGFDRTRAISTQTAEEIARAASTFGQEDDITVLTVRLSAIPATV